MKPALVALAVALAATTAGPGHVLDGPRYRFCHDPDYPLTAEEHAYCPIIGASNRTCATLPEACKHPPIAGARGGLRPVRGRGDDGGARSPRPSGEGEWRGGEGPGEGRAPPERARPDEERDGAPVLSGAWRWIFFLVIAAFFGLLLREIARSFLRDREASSPADDTPVPEIEAPAEPTARDPIEIDVERLLARARAAAARGDYARGLDDVYAALLRRLDGDGLIEIHASRTNGDYLRQLRKKPEVRGPVREIFRDVERVQFGAGSASEQAFRSVLGRVIPLVSRALGAALAFAFLSATLSCAPHGGGAIGDGEDSEDTSPSGTQALIDLLAASGIEARHRAEPLRLLDEPETLVLLPGAEVRPEEWDGLLSWVANRGGTLIVAGEHAMPASEGARVTEGERPFTNLSVGYTSSLASLRFDPASPPGLKLVPTGDVSPADFMDRALLLRGDEVYATSRDHGQGRVIAFADGHLFTNLALTIDDNAAFLVALARSSPLPQRVELVDVWSSAGADTPFEAVNAAELTPVIAQLVLLLALVVLWKGAPFARLRDPAERSRRAFSDHARALGLAYHRARASRHVLGLYAVWALDRLRERVQRSGSKGLVPLAEAIAARTGRSEAEVMRVLVEASSARDEAAPPSLRPSSRHGAPAVEATSREEPKDMILFREMQGFLAATGQRRERRRGAVREER